MEKQVQKTVTELKQASRKNNAPIWSKLAKSLLKSSPTKKVVNIKKINELDLNQDEKEWFDKGVSSVKSALAGIDI